MKLKEGFVTHETDGEYVMVAAGASDFNGLVRCNPTAGFIIDCLKQETSEAEIVEAMLAQFDATREQVTAAVAKVLTQLRGIGALDE